MDFIIESKKTGSEGGKQRVENQKIKENTLEGVLEPPLEPNNKVLNINKKEEKINNKLIKYRSFDHLSMSVEEFNKLIENGYCKEEIDDILDSIENNKNNGKYKSLYLTANMWLKRNKKTETINKSGILNFD